MSSVSAAVPDEAVRPWSPGGRLGPWAAAALLLLAVVETGQAVVAPLLAPQAKDWQAAGDHLRSQFRPGDLIVAAPAWADPLMRLQVGDLVPMAVAARMDEARFGRVWVLSQRNAHAAEEVDRAQTYEARFGQLTLRRFERQPAVVTYDFLERWQDAYVTHWNPTARVLTPCPWSPQQSFVCPVAGNSVSRALVEVDQQIKRALLAPPVLGGVVAVEFQAVVLGDELVIAAGLHDTWARKSPGTAHLEIWIGGEPAGPGLHLDNRSGWSFYRIDTTARAGHTLPVRFQVTSPQPAQRHVAFAAEARR